MKFSKRLKNKAVRARFAKLAPEKHLCKLGRRMYKLQINRPFAYPTYGLNL